MAPSVDWTTFVITVPTSDLTLISGTKYEYDINTLKADLETIMASEEGEPFPKIFNHNTTLTLSGTVYARSLVILDPYTITFQDAAISVNLFGGNHNILDVVNDNQVSVKVQNSAGLIEAGTSLTTEESSYLEQIVKILRNELTLDPSTGRLKILDDDDSTTFLEADAYEDMAKTQKYRGQGTAVRERLQ